ncbi:MAG: histone deacetylase [Cyclobacteriaceae bacterium]|jgi:acetoin utilization deacetylase AcuC-like enzyme|nr:histone deacetylase [Cyclobacteriaceae bacterium]
MLRIAWKENYVLPLPANHRFPMSKYEVLPQQLMYEGTAKSENFFAPRAADLQAVLRVHDRDYVHRLFALSLTDREVRRTGFPLTRALVEREVTIMQGTVESALFARQYGVAMNIAGGTHHAFADRGEGFCLLNDIAIAAQYLLDHQLARQILIVDLDVHQGNGTAQIFRDEPRVFTFSMHGANNYPLQKERSNWDIGLPDFTNDAFYLKTLDAALKQLLDTVQPDFIFFQSGVDILETDTLGKLAVTRQGCKQRDRLVLELAKRHHIPLVASMGGGYSPDFRDIIEAHANTFRLAQEIFF